MGKSNKSILQKYSFKQRDNQWWGLVFVLPFLLGFVLIFVQMLISGVQFAFSDVSVKNGLSISYTGFENFYYVLRVDANYIKYLVDDIEELVTTMPIILVFSLFVAVVLNSKIWGRTAFRAIFFLPVIACTGLLSNLDAGNAVVSTMNSAANSTDSTVLTAMGDVSIFLQSLKFSPELISMVSGAANNVMGIVNRSGVQILIFLAGIQSISPSIYESAKVEGASAWETFWKITLPMVTPMLLVNVIYTFIESLTRDNTVLMNYIENMAFSKGKYGYAAAMAWLHFLVIAVILVLVLLIIWRYTKALQKAKKEERGI